VDGYGTADLPDEFISSMTEAGVRFHSFDPQPRLVGMRTNLFRRLHRKIVVIDGQRAFIGGINYSADHLGDFGPRPSRTMPWRSSARWWPRCMPAPPDVARCCSRQPVRPPPPPAGQRPCWWSATTCAAPISKPVPAGVSRARQRIVVANAYFFPGYRLLRELRNAARRGVEVTLILRATRHALGARAVAAALQLPAARRRAHPRVLPAPLHGKVALVDDQWATVGSSNLDPLSLSFNLEANLFIRDRAFNQHLYQHLSNWPRTLQAATLERMVRGYWWRAPLIFVGFHVIRHFRGSPAGSRRTASACSRCSRQPRPRRLPRGQHLMARHAGKTWGKRLLTCCSWC
jgi:cardiolipin synthase